MEPQDDEGLFAQTGQDNQQQDGALSDENGQVPTNEQTIDETDDDLDIPAEDGIAEDDDLEEDEDESAATGGDTAIPAATI